MDKNEFNQKAVKFILAHGRGCALAAAAVCGAILLLVSSFLTSREGGEIAQSGSDELSAYLASLEEHLSDTVSKINGAGKTSVFITLDCSFETVYANNAKLDESSSDYEKSQKTTEKQLATADGETPVIVKRLSPKIKGVLIVCEGGENQSVKNDIVRAASVALNISSNRIYVTGGNTSS